MVKLSFSPFPVLLLAALQVGCTAMPNRAHALRSSPEVLTPTCDTSVRYISLTTTMTNHTGRDMQFHLDGDRGPPFDPWYMGYRVHASAPGEPLQLVHNSGHDSVWTRTIAIAPGNSAEFNIPIFGLRPADFHHYFRIELRDSKGRSHWTPEFDLCSVSRPRCGCPRLSTLAVCSQAVVRSCPAVSSQ